MRDLSTQCSVLDLLVDWGVYQPLGNIGSNGIIAQWLTQGA